jgi:CheY-like chemotaxis protein
MYNILIVDDSDIDRMMIESNLRIPEAVPIIAENGQRALDKLREWSIDLVLTDLMMPRVDGVELVAAMRKEFPDVPVIVTTGMDTEGMAAQAIQAGAVGYIQKNHLPEMLRPTVQRILELRQLLNDSRQLQAGMRTSHFEFDFSNDATQLRNLVNYTTQLLGVVTPLSRNQRLRIAMAMEHALNNALYRGNLEMLSEYKVPFAMRTSDIKHLELVDSRLNSQPYQDRRIQVVVDIKPTRFAIRVKDGGRGFNPDEWGSWEHANARGIILMRAFMDAVEYSQDGNDVQMYFLFERDACDRPIAPVHLRPHTGNAHTGNTRVTGARTANAATTAATQAASPLSRPAPETAAAPQPHRFAAKPRVASLKCVKSGKMIILHDEKSIIGSRANCHVQLSQHSQVAPLHCFIAAEPGGWFLVQLSPQLPTLINTHQVEGRAKLKHGDIINLGSNDLEFELVSSS